jgi:Do/DeqQ family serine protease
MKKIFVLLLTGFIGAVLALTGAHFLGFGKTIQLHASALQAPTQMVKMPVINSSIGPLSDFTYAAEKSLPAVVHIKSITKVKGHKFSRGFDPEVLPEPFRQFFGLPFGNDGNAPQQEPSDQVLMGSGSGVIISTDGYIVTNNHVISDAEELIVTLNNHKAYMATVIGSDPSTDIALLKIDEKNLPIIKFSDSDAIKVGQWVVAVGNPFNLESTVTAGIVSANSRSINIMQDKSPIESFIQTDAAINPGNSGGALVNLEGDLVGINTAISSPTGSYAGYGFAVPSNIVFKITSDLIDFGTVQRGYMGAMIRSLDGELAKEKGLNIAEGVYIDSLVSNSSAAQSGIKVGDVVIAIDGINTTTTPKMLEMIGRHRPGDKVVITLIRNGDEKEIAVILKNSSGTTDIIKKDRNTELFESLGVTFEPISHEEASAMGIEGGLKISNLKAGKFSNHTDVHEGFVITKVDGQKVTSIKDLNRILNNKKGGVMFEGKYQNSDQVYYYAFGL